MTSQTYTDAIAAHDAVDPRDDRPEEMMMTQTERKCSHWFRRLPETGQCDKVAEYESAMQVALAQFRKMAALEESILADAKVDWTDSEIAHARQYSTLTDTIAALIEPEAWKEYFENDGKVANMDRWKCTESLAQAKRITDWLTD